MSTLEPTTKEEREEWKKKTDRCDDLSHVICERLIEDVESLRGRNKWWRDHFENTASANASIAASLRKKVEALEKQLLIEQETERQKCCDEIREKCLSCDGTGIDDTLDPPGSPCQWCGIPIDRIKEMEDV